MIGGLHHHRLAGLAPEHGTLPRSQVDPEHAANGKQSSIRPMTKEALHGNSSARGRERRAAPFDSAALFMWRAASPGDINFAIDLAFFANLSDRIAFRIGSTCRRMSGRCERVER